MLIAILFSACCKEKPQPSVYDLKIVKSKQIELEDGDIDYVFAQEQVINIDGKNIIILNVAGKKLAFYNIDEGKKEHEILTDSTRTLSSFYYQNKDSIFIYYNYSSPVEIDITTPGQFQLIDYNGNIKTKFPYNIDTTDIPAHLKLSNLLPPRLNSNLIPVIGDNVIFATFSKYKGHVGTKEFMENRFPLALRYNIKEQKFYVSKLYSFPYIEEGIYYPTSWHVDYFSISKNNLPLIRYNYSSSIFEWDYINDKLITHSFKSRLIDTIMPMETPSTYHFHTLECAYQNAHYDKYRELYFLEFYFNENFYINNRDLYSVIIADKDFNYLGELYCNKSWPAYYLEDYILDINPSGPSTIRVDYLELVKTDRNFDEYIDSCKNDLAKRKEEREVFKKSFSKDKNPLLEFINSKNLIKEDNYTIITIYPKKGCIGCNDFILEFISEQRATLEYTPFYLIFTSNNPKNIEEELEKYNLKDFKNLIIDSEGIIDKQTIHNGLLNPRLTIIRDGKVITDEIFKSEETETVLFPGLLNSLGLCIRSE